MISDELSVKLFDIIHKYEERIEKLEKKIYSLAESKRKYNSDIFVKKEETSFPFVLDNINFLSNIFLLEDIMDSNVINSEILLVEREKYRSYSSGRGSKLNLNDDEK